MTFFIIQGEGLANCPANDFSIFCPFQICTSSLCDSLRLLGCFTSQKTLQDCDDTFLSKEENTFYNLFISNILEPRWGLYTWHSYKEQTDITVNFINNFIVIIEMSFSFPEHIPMSLSYACIVLRMLYDVALDVYDKPNATAIISFKSPSHRNRNSIEVCFILRNSSSRGVNMFLLIFFFFPYEASKIFRFTIWNTTSKHTESYPTIS